MFNTTFKLLTSTLAVIVLTTNTYASPKAQQKIDKETAQLEAVYAALIKDKPARNFANRKPAILKASFATKKSNPAKTVATSSRNKTYANSLRVEATAYTSHVNQTDSTPNIAAWGDRLYPGMKSIAVSRDLLNVYGLKHKQKVRIKGLKGEYAVLDKMNKRWKKKIDIYMGMDKRKAFKWGRRKVEILWN